MDKYNLMLFAVGLLLLWLEYVYLLKKIEPNNQRYWIQIPSISACIFCLVISLLCLLFGLFSSKGICFLLLGLSIGLLGLIICGSISYDLSNPQEVTNFLIKYDLIEYLRGIRQAFIVKFVDVTEFDEFLYKVSYLNPDDKALKLIQNTSQNWISADELVVLNNDELKIIYKDMISNLHESI